MNFVVVVRYTGKDKFYYYSPCFVASTLTEAISIAPTLIAEEWKKISPHPPPTEVVDILPGVMGMTRI